MDKIFRERLKQLMLKNDINGYQLAKRIVIPNATLRNWLSGRSIPKDTNLNKLADYFDVHPAWLRFGDKRYERSLKHESERLAEEAQKYGLATVKKMRKMLEIWVKTEK